MKPYEFTGRIIKVEDTQTYKTKNGEFRKRKFIAEADSDSKYPTRMFFELQNDLVDEIDKRKEGRVATVKFYIDCRSWTNPGTQKYYDFITLKAVRINSEGTASKKTEVPSVPDAPEEVAEASEDLPF